jgi:ribosomal protein S18 acetylase RimI-like enzyme
VFLPGSTVGLADEASPEVVVVELGENYRYEPCQEMRISRDIRTSLFEVAEAWPEASVWTLTPLWHSDETHSTHRGSCFAVVPDLIRGAVAANPGMHLVEGSRLLQASPVLMADGYEHPNAGGSKTIAERLAFIMDALSEPAETRRARAIELLSDGPREAFPILECARRGIGEVLVAEKGVCILEIPHHGTFVWGTAKKALREALDVFASRDFVCVLGSAPVHDVCRDLGLTEDVPCNMVIYEKGRHLDVDPTLDIRTLTPAYAELVAEHYSHPEYLAAGELEDILERGLVLGGFEAGRLCAFVGEHPEGAIGMLEVFPEQRRRGWATALESAKINEQLDRGLVPWGEVWPDNRASIALQEKLGLTVHPEKDMRFLSRA